MGIVRTNKIGSDTQYYICEREEWEAMNQEEKEKAVQVGVWGVIEAHPENADYNK